MNRLLLVLFLLTLVALGLFGMGTYPQPKATVGTQSIGTPSTATDFYAVGYKASAAGRYDEAISDFKSAIALKADYAEAYNMLAYCLRKTGKVQESMQNYDKALSLKPNFPEAREYYGEAFLMDNNLYGAVSQYIILQKRRRPEANILLESIADYLKEHPTP